MLSAEFLALGCGDGDRDILVDIVDTDADEAEEADRILLEAPLASGSSLSRSCFRPLSSSNLASCSSAIPFLKIGYKNQHCYRTLNETYMRRLGKGRNSGIHTFEEGLLEHRWPTWEPAWDSVIAGFWTAERHMAALG